MRVSSWGDALAPEGLTMIRGLLVIASILVACHAQGALMIQIEEQSGAVRASFTGSANTSTLNFTSGSAAYARGLNNSSIFTQTTGYSVFTLPGLFTSPFGTGTFGYSSTTGSGTIGFGRWTNGTAALFAPLNQPSGPTPNVSFTGTFSGGTTLADFGLSPLATTSYLNGQVQVTISKQLLGGAAPVPEPSTLAVFALGGIGIVAGGIRRRRIQNAR